MTVDDFNEWRENYDKMSYADQVAFYNQVAVDHPLQCGFDAGAFGRFFGHISCRHQYMSVVEFGGWKGELAKWAFSFCPRLISAWVNYEISQKAIEQPVTQNFRYVAIVPHDFVWRLNLPSGDVFISSHAIEHIREWQLELLFSNVLPVTKYIGLQAPLADGPTDWTDYHGSHILECGWSRIIEILESCSFQLFMEDNEFRGFERINHHASLESSRPDNIIPATKPAHISQ